MSRIGTRSSQTFRLQQEPREPDLVHNDSRAQRYLMEVRGDEPGLRVRILLSIVPAPAMLLVAVAFADGTMFESYAPARIMLAAAGCVMVAHAAGRKLAFWLLYRDAAGERALTLPWKHRLETLAMSATLGFISRGVAIALATSAIIAAMNIGLPKIL